MKKFLVFVIALVTTLVVGVVMLWWWQGQASGQPDYFESAIRKFEAGDAQAMPEPGGIVFTGSSSIRFWGSLAEDMAPLRIIQRGFGGAHMEHVIHNAHRIVTPYEPRAVVVFVGGNDIASGKNVARVSADFDTFVREVRRRLPDADLWLLSMKPSRSRWNHWPALLQVSAHLQDIAARDSQIRFVDVGSVLLNDAGEPDNVYVLDGLHLNKEGYRRWTKVLRPLLIDTYAPLHGLVPNDLSR